MIIMIMVVITVIIINAHAHFDSFAGLSIFRHACVRMHVRVYVYACVYIYIYVCMYVCIYSFVYLLLYDYLFTHTYVYIYIYIVRQGLRGITLGGNDNHACCALTKASATPFSPNFPIRKSRSLVIGGFKPLETCWGNHIKKQKIRNVLNHQPSWILMLDGQ